MSGASGASGGNGKDEVVAVVAGEAAGRLRTATVASGVNAAAVAGAVVVVAAAVGLGVTNQNLLMS